MVVDSSEFDLLSIDLGSYTYTCPKRFQKAVFPNMNYARLSRVRTQNQDRVGLDICRCNIQDSSFSTSSRRPVRVFESEEDAEELNTVVTVVAIVIMGLVLRSESARLRSRFVGEDSKRLMG